MSIAKYVKQFLRESNTITVQPVVVTTDSDNDEVLDNEVESVDTVEESTPYAGGALAADQLSKEISDERTVHGKRQSQINKQDSNQNKGSKSITKDVEKSGNVDDYNGYKDSESTTQAQRQADLNKLTTHQNTNSKGIEDDLKKSDSATTIKDGKTDTKKLKNKRQDQLKSQSTEQIGTDESSAQSVTKRESVDFINKFTFTESRPQAGSSKNPDVEPSIGGEVKSGVADTEKMAAKRDKDLEKQKSNQIKGKKLTTDVESSKSTETFVKGGKDADKMTDSRVKDLDSFIKSQKKGEKSTTKDLETSDSAGVIKSSDKEAQSQQSKRTSKLASFQASQQAESYNGDDKKSMDVFKGVDNPNNASVNTITGDKTKPKEDPKTKLEKNSKMKDEDVYDAGNVKGMKGIDSREDVPLRNKKYKKGTAKTTDTEQSVKNTPVPKESCVKKGKVVKDESQLVTQIGKEAEAAAKSNLKNSKAKAESVEDRASALFDSIQDKVEGLPSDEILLTMKNILSTKDYQIEESMKKELIHKGYINVFSEVTEGSKQILRTKEARKRLAELSL